MNQILELREKRAKAWDAAKAFLDSKRGADGMLSAEDAATYDKMEADVVNLGREAVSYTHLDVYKRQPVYHGIHRNPQKARKSPRPVYFATYAPRLEANGRYTGGRSGV